MSALGHQRTLDRDFATNALRPKADIQSVVIDVRYVPKAEVSLTFRSIRLENIGNGLQGRYPR